MKGYIYTLFAGADPAQGWTMTDPIFSDVPTLGACVPNIRRLVEPGDWIFAISGRVPGVRQYVVGGMKVAEKIDALAAYRRFPRNRLTRDADGNLNGNIIVDSSGQQSPLDYHSNFERRVANFIVGRDAVTIDSEAAVARARSETATTLGDMFERPGRSLAEILGRWRKLDSIQIESLVSWMRTVAAER